MRVLHARGYGRAGANNASGPIMGRAEVPEITRAYCTRKLTIQSSDGTRVRAVFAQASMALSGFQTKLE